MSRDPGDIPASSQGRIDLVAALSVARDLPVEALERAAANPGRIAADVLAAIERAGAGKPLSEREGNLLFWGLHALAEAGETRLFAPLLRLMRLPDETLEELLGDTITETFPRIAVSSYDGDWPALADALADPAFNDFARWNLFLAFAYLAETGRIDRDEARAFLARFDDERRVSASDRGWMGWESAIALLGAAELEGRVAAARADGRLLEDLSSPEDFEMVMALAASAPADLARYAEQGLGPFGTAVDELEEMLSLLEEGEAIAPVQNPLRHVGRNDPCPCGSGRKFKKCCLAA